LYLEGEQSIGRDRSTDLRLEHGLAVEPDIEVLDELD
jgi:hypothetical protein